LPDQRNEARPPNGLREAGPSGDVTDATDDRIPIGHVRGVRCDDASVALASLHLLAGWAGAPGCAVQTIGRERPPPPSAMQEDRPAAPADGRFAERFGLLLSDPRGLAAARAASYERPSDPSGAVIFVRPFHVRKCQQRLCQATGERTA
jgi:hypothetical protein